MMTTSTGIVHSSLLVLHVMNSKVLMNNANSPGLVALITRYGSTLYIGIAMVVPIPQYIRKCQFLLSVSSEFDF